MSKRPDPDRRDGKDDAPDPGGDGAEPSPRVYILTREAARELDRLATDEYLIPSILLMENAARHVAEVAFGLVRPADEPTIAIFCGPGNNGGDGLAAARHLHNAGARVRVVLSTAPERYTGDAAVNLRIVEKMGVKIGHGEAAAPGPDDAPAVVVDALLGTGLTCSVNPAMASMITRLNQLARMGSKVVSVDLPSGLDADTGAVLGVAVRADVTVTFAGPKPGLCTLEAQAYVGDLLVADIGAPRALVERLGTPIPEVPPDHE
ncbi:MAG: NAD(P)H-hydrate epimerase [Phycisphaerales bacterium]|nr:NAD(P)H-hydrate epimerase [Phycisphaerales bacterium]